MPVSREQQRFPTRNYPYREGRFREAASLTSSPPDTIAPTPNVLYRRVIGIDAQERPMTAEELSGLDDPFGRLLRSGKAFPLSLRQLLQAIDALNGTPDALPNQLVFLVADGGHVIWTPATDPLQRAYRFAIARGTGEFPLLISTGTLLNSTEDQAFLQVLGWDASHEVFHYYERLRGTFFWAGMSHHALQDATRGKGPFDSHVNGSVVMKELRAPWIHWHAPQAGINEDSLAPNDPLRAETLFRDRITAERLETEVVRPGIRRWNDSRVRKAIGADGVWRQIPHYLRQAVTDTTVNLATSDTASRLLTDESLLRPPLSFFLNRDTLFDTLDLVPEDPSVTRIVISGEHYRRCLQKYDVHRSDGAMRIEGDAHFAFLTPEAAFEDTHLVEAMVQSRLLTPRFVACLTMTDFPNPVFSQRRAVLLRYVPKEAGGPNGEAGTHFESLFVKAIEAAIAADADGAGQVDSPEREFLANWQTEDFGAAFIQRITAYCHALQDSGQDPDVVDGWFQLAEYRRRRFRRRPLAEFTLTTPRTNIPENAPPLRMTSLGRVEVTPNL